MTPIDQVSKKMERKKKKDRQLRVKDWAMFIVGALILWQIGSLIVNNNLVLPSPIRVGKQMLLQMQNPDMYISCGMTIARALSALVLSFVIALPLSFLATFYSKYFRLTLDRIAALMQTVPNVCYIIMLLFWTSRNATVILTGIFLLCPLIYRALVEQLDVIIDQWTPIWILYPQPTWVLMSRICFSMLKPAIASALKSASSMAFKVCVTSEILTGLTPGIGRNIQLARLDLNAAGVLGWSIWLVILSFGFEALWHLWLQHLFASDEHSAKGD